jgi:hypothetical protein
MRKFRAYATITYELYCDFEVEDDEDEWAFAKDLDGGDFKEIDGSGEWNMYEVELLGEEK